MLNFGINPTNNGSENNPMNVPTAIAILVGAVIGFVILLAGLAVINAYILSTLWGWYIVPAFNLPKLSLIHAFGVSLIVHYLTFKPLSKEDNKWSKNTLITLCMPFFALLLGWIGAWFM